MLRRFALLSALMWAGCSCGERTTCGSDARCDGGRPDSGRDARVAPIDARVPTTCSEARPCPSGQSCVDGECTIDLCAAAGLACGDQLCRASCVPVSDPCIGVTCGEDETCIGGRCIPGCFRNPCEGVTCNPSVRHCDPASGACVQTVHCDRLCPEGTVCHAQCVPRDPCADVDCADTERCSGGECIDDPCAGVECAGDTEVCIEGECFDTCACSPLCDAGDRCVFGSCECAPSCSAGGNCGESDGCGGTCPGECGLANFYCEVTTVGHQCGCVADCWRAGTQCGDPTGCVEGATCLGECESGEICVGDVSETRHCECAPSCGEAACGAPDGCGGTCATGACPGGEFCADGFCCEQDCAPDAQCGDPDGCGGGCFGPCPEGETCAVDRDGRYRCACTDLCEPGAACGDPSPCGGGSCPGSCPVGETCSYVGSGYRCVCEPDCSGRPCGAIDGCGGVCRAGRCPGGEFCADGVCLPPACSPPCGCGEICAGTTCRPLCVSGETLCGCDRCCVAGEICLDGACVPDLI